MPPKPQHNKYDNIHEIRMMMPKGTVTDVVDSEVRLPKRTERIGRAVLYGSVGHFVRDILRRHEMSLPAWKIVLSHLGTPDKGDIFYVAEVKLRKDSKEYTPLIFRGTFGYLGTGPHESACVEEVFDNMGIPLELRGDGDILLSFIRKTYREDPK